jgi:adenosylcobinamide-phosphate synthase
MGFIPSIYAALLLTLAVSFTPTAQLHKGIAAWLGHKNRSPYEQGGFPLSALAWSLNVSLGGASQDISGSAIKGEWVGPDGATAQVGHKHLRRGIYINVIAHILFIASLLGAYMWGAMIVN